MRRKTDSPVYRSGAGREQVLTAYRAQAARVPFPFESRYVSTAFGRTHVAIAGPEDAPPLVVLSGVHFGAFFTLEWLARLEPRYRLYVPDVVGQPNLSAETRPRPAGHAYGRWLAGVLDALGIGTARMAGISFGGAIVLDLAAVAPERIERAALLVPGGLATGSALRIAWRVFLPWTLYRWFPHPERVPEIVRPLGEDVPEHWHRFFDLLLRHVHWAARPPGPFRPAELARYEAPTLAVFAREDCFFPAERAEAAAQKLLGPDVTTRTLPRKHLPEPGELASIEKVILAFLASA